MSLQPSRNRERWLRSASPRVFVWRRSCSIGEHNRSHMVSSRVRGFNRVRGFEFGNSGPLLGVDPTSRDPRRDAANSDTLIVGVSGARQNAAVAACVDGELRAYDQRIRIRRVQIGRAHV